MVVPDECDGCVTAALQLCDDRNDQPDDRPDAEDNGPDHDIEPNHLARLNSSILFPLAALLKPSDRFLDRVWMSAMWALLGSTRYQSTADPAGDCHVAWFLRAV